jgi:uncharacterized protein (DUF488 family)
MAIQTANLHNLEILTIGVYGFSEANFFNSLVEAGVDTLCDIRQRRGVRGAAYSFANSSKLQRKLKALGIRYIYYKALAPTTEVRAIQKKHDIEVRVKKQQRDVLSESFITAYEMMCLSTFNPLDFITTIGPDAKAVALFCVERKPTACHRSLVANKLSDVLGVEVRHLEP